MKTRFGLAAVLASMSWAAGAQEVTLYGMVDMGLLSDKVSGSPGRIALDSGLYAPSRFGIRGSERLGASTQAFFVLENGFATDTGIQGNGGRLFGREANVGLRDSRWGLIRLGRTINLGWRWAPSVASPFGLSFLNSGVYSSFAFDDAPYGNGRADNAVYYESPVLGGFQIGAGYSFSVNGGEVAGSGNNTRLYDVAARYADGPLSVVVNYLHSKQGGAAAAPQDPKSLLAAVSYDFGPVKVHAGYNRIRDANAQSTGSAIANTGWLTATRNDDNAYSLGVSAPLGKGRVLVGAQRLSSADISIYAVGYTYNLSKRTMLYGFANHNTTRNFTAARDVKRRQLAVGIWHSF